MYSDNVPALFAIALL